MKSGGRKSRARQCDTMTVTVIQANRLAQAFCTAILSFCLVVTKWMLNFET